MTDTEPRDLDLIDDLHARAATWSASAEVRATLAMVPLLTAEVRRLREPTHCPGCDGFQMVTEVNGSEHKYGCQGVPT